jgi:hypothetical protein
VLDNADGHDMLYGTKHAAGIVDFLPESEKGMTVFTTRVEELAVSLTRGDFLELGSMSKPDATILLEKSLIELLHELVCLPLAIAQAAAYLNDFLWVRARQAAGAPTGLQLTELHDGDARADYASREELQPLCGASTRQASALPALDNRAFRVDPPLLVPPPHYSANDRLT